MKSWNSGKGRNIQKLTKSFLEEKINQGYSVNRIAKEVDCNRNSVYKKLAEFGLEITKNQSAKSSKALMIEKFGGPSPFCSEKVRQKKEETLKKKYGVENISQVKEIQDKIKQTNLRRYGVESYLSTEDAQQKSREKKKQKYGTDNLLSLKEIQQKSKETMKQKYGVEYNWQREEIKEKAKQTILTKYGYENPFGNKEIQDKAIKTQIRRYGGLGMQSPIIAKKIIETNLKKYGSETGPSFSKKEKEVLLYVKSIYKGKIIENDHSVLGNQELDIYLPELSIAIEFNGAYWHSEEIKGKNYHKDKTKLCLDKGIRLIHIYEWEWDNQKEMIKTFLRFCLTEDSRRIYARKCEIRNVDRKTYHDYCRKNHLQGAKAGTKDLTVYGLYYNDELVQLMSFDKPARSTKYQWEIIRGCPGSMNHVIGGNSKLFKHFIREKNPDNIMSKCDFDKFDGRGYYAMGMELVSWQNRCYDVWNEGGTLKATSYRPRRKENILKREQQMKNGFKLYSAGTGEFVWRKKDV